MPGFNSIDGLSSGLNTTEIVDTIMEFERRPAALLEIQQAEKTAKVSALQALSAKFIGLNTAAIPLNTRATFEKASLIISDESILSATSSGQVSKGTFDLQVLELARNHQVASQGFDNNDSSSFGTGTITLQVGNDNLREITIDSGSNSLTGIKDAINDANTGVSASIINDGTSSNSFRLILTSNKTGKESEIQFNSNLTGGTDSFNFSTSSFDNAEIISFNDNSTSAISLGMTAANSGTENKTYTFTVASAGAQTIGSDVITLDWTDGINSGSVLITQADSDVELVGAGADGLSLSFSAGQLNEGDSFQINSFTPLLQEATDAIISFGTGGGGGSPITITSDTNTFKDVIENVDFTVQKITADGETVSINTDVDTAGIKDKINAYITAYNSLVEYVDNQNKFTEGDDLAPPLFGDSTVWSVSNSLRRNTSSLITGIESKFNQLYAIGIRTKSDGTLGVVNSSALDKALSENLDDVIKMFVDSANSSNTGISFISSTEETRTNIEFSVDITQAATRGGYAGEQLVDLSSNPITLDSTNNKLKLKVDGLVSDEIVLSEKTYNSTDALITELQQKIDADEKIGSRGVLVEWVDNEDGTGYVKVSSASYGSTSKIEFDKSIGNTAYAKLGLATGSVIEGKDVEGTINGEEAEGTGQVLKGIEGNEYSDGLKIKVDIDEAAVTDGIEGTVEVVKGFAARQVDMVNSLTRSETGLFDRKIAAEQKQIEHLTERIEDIDALLSKRRDSLFLQFFQMEEALSQLNVISGFLTTQLAGLENLRIK